MKRVWPPLPIPDELLNKPAEIDGTNPLHDRGLCAICQSHNCWNCWNNPNNQFKPTITATTAAPF